MAKKKNSCCKTIYGKLVHHKMIDLELSFVELAKKMQMQPTHLSTIVNGSDPRRKFTKEKWDTLLTILEFTAEEKLKFYASEDLIVLEKRKKGELE